MRLFALVISALLITLSSPALAIDLPVPAPPVIGAKSYLVIDNTTGFEVASLNPDERLAPASLTKLMTAYAVFASLKEGQVALADEVTISEKAWRTPGSRMFIEVGKRVTIEDLLLGMIVQSGNDASVALAEHIGGTESVFAEMMNRYATRLGMSGSRFQNSTGLPDDEHYTTARDMAILARAIISEFPDYYRWYAVREFTYNGIKQPNRNELLWRDDSVDGIKTGHTDDAGYCLVSSAERDGMRLVAVVMGTASSKARVDGSQALINYGFRFFETRRLYSAGEQIAEARVWKAANEMTPLGLPEDLYITVPRGSYDRLESVLNMPATVMAPLAKGQPVGELQVSLAGNAIVTEPLRALSDNPAGSFWQRASDSVSLWFE
ncbi:MAG: D-alanyl-D-alanine carboxypeptidase family protein [Woeseia sp.]